MKAVKQVTAKPTLNEFEYVTCEGCVFSKPYNDFNGHTFCTNRKVKMIVVISDKKPCVHKQLDNGKEEKRI
jgi:hypothetical protein